jgi:hypothetical protein
LKLLIHVTAHFLGLVPIIHMTAHFPGLIPLIHMTAHFPVLVPRIHMTAHCLGLVPLIHMTAHIPGLVPLIHMTAHFPGFVTVCKTKWWGYTRFIIPSQFIDFDIFAISFFPLFTSIFGYLTEKPRSHFSRYIGLVWFGFMVLNATFNNISAIS